MNCLFCGDTPKVSPYAVKEGVVCSDCHDKLYLARRVVRAGSTDLTKPLSSDLYRSFQEKPLNEEKEGPYGNS